MERDNDPKLSEAGFMDLVLELQKRFLNDETIREFLRQKPMSVADALRGLEKAANGYVGAIDNEARNSPSPKPAP